MGILPGETIPAQLPQGETTMKKGAKWTEEQRVTYLNGMRNKRRDYHGANNPKWRGGPQGGICQQCGQPFTAPLWQLENRKYCSHECYSNSKIIPIARNCRTHLRVVERILNHRLPVTAVIHHFNSNRKDNSRGNLVVCQDQAYHILLHSRKRIYGLGGNPNTDKICSKCGEVKRKTEFHKAKRADGCRCYCKDCQSFIAKEKYYGAGQGDRDYRAQS